MGTALKCSKNKFHDGNSHENEATASNHLTFGLSMPIP